MKNTIKKTMLPALFIIFCLSMVGCATGIQHQTVEYVDMERFSGDWFVVALIPTAGEEGARYGVENYSVDEEGRINVLYTFERDGKDKIITQRGWIEDTFSNAEWRVQPFWPLKLPFFVLELDDDYSYTAIATDSFRYLWIMSRSPQMNPAQLEAVIDRMVSRGFPREDIIMMPQEAR